MSRHHGPWDPICNLSQVAACTPGPSSPDGLPGGAGACSLPGSVCVAGSSLLAAPCLRGPSRDLRVRLGSHPAEFRNPGVQRTRPEEPVTSQVGPLAALPGPALKGGCHLRRAAPGSGGRLGAQAAGVAPGPGGRLGALKTAFVVLAVVLPVFPAKVSGLSFIVSDAPGLRVCRSGAVHCAQRREFPNWPVHQTSGMECSDWPSRTGGRRVECSDWPVLTGAS